MTRATLFATFLLAAFAGSTAAQTLQLPPPTPAQAPHIPMAAPKPAPAVAVPAAAPAPAAAAPAKPAAVAPSSGVVPRVATSGTQQAKPRQKPRRRVAATPAAPKDPYADLPVNAPAKQALARSAAWGGNESATVASGADGRVVFTFGETMPTVVCAPLRICDIELQAGETVAEMPHIGDDVRWSVSPGITGAGDSRTTHVLVKPQEAGLDTNLLIPTNRRMYRLRLVSSDSNYVSVVSFHYPKDEKAAWDAALSAQGGEEAKVVAELPAMSIESLDFNYGVTVKKGAPRWKPVRVFADGERTYIQLPDGTTNQDAPAVIALTPDGSEQLVNFRFRGGYVIVDRVLDRAALMSGLGGDAQRIEIERGCARRSFTGKCKG